MQEWLATLASLKDLPFPPKCGANMRLIMAQTGKAPPDHQKWPNGTRKQDVFSLLFLEIQNSASLKNRMCLLWCSEYQSRAKRHLVGLLFFWYHYYSKLCTIHVKWLIDSLPNAQSIDFCAKTASRRLGGVSPKSITKYLLLCKSRNKMTFLPHSILKTRKNRHFFKMCERSELVTFSLFFCS